MSRKWFAILKVHWFRNSIFVRNSNAGCNCQKTIL